MHKLFQSFFCLLLMLLNACQTTDPQTNALSPYGSQISLNVSDFLIINDTEMDPIKETRIYPSSLDAELQAWATLRIKAAGKAGKAVLRILDAKVTEKNIESFLNSTNSDEAAYLAVNIVISLELENALDGNASKAELRLYEQLPLAREDFDTFDRAVIWQRFVNKILNEVNKKFESLILSDFASAFIHPVAVEEENS